MGTLLALFVVALIGTRMWLAATYDLTTINGESVHETIVIMLAFATYLVVGIVLVLRRPDHRLGWVLTAVGVLTLVGVLAESYALATFVKGAGLPGGVFAAWIHNWYWFPLLVLILLFVPLLFPTGRPLTPRWNWLYHAATAALLLMTVLPWMKPTLTDGARDNPRYSIDNPIGVAAIGDPEQSSYGDVLFIVVLVLCICALVSLAIRFRRSCGLERQQMKLFVFAGFIMVLLPLAEELGLHRFVPESNAFFAVGIALPPITIGVAILRYRLYDIDRIISRTVSYALLTAVLLALYLAAVTAITAVTAPVAGDSAIAVAAATLLAAAAFRPARARIQAVVDRRFNRARYDADRTASEFRAHLRDQLDLTTIASDLQRVVTGSVQPSRCVVWLRPETRS